MFKFITNLFDEQSRALDAYGKIVDQINDLEPEMTALSNTKLAAQTKKLQQRLSELTAEGMAEHDALTQLLPEAFATVRETARRVLGMRHYDVQLLAGIALHHGAVTEQKTGEGKTLTVTAPLYLNALTGKGAHLITVNDYLAELGAGWMGPVYHFLGMSTSVIAHNTSRKFNPDIDSAERGDERLEHFEDITRREAYRTDITYGTNNEFGFDYLRDNMVQALESMVQREDTPHYFTIVDEADSILIDEARTPLIISAPDTEPTKKYFTYAKMVKSLTKDADYSVDEKSKAVTLTDLGVKRIEKQLGVTNLYEESFDTIHHVEAALKARTIYTRDKDYIVREGEVIIVDEHTGRLMYGRRYSDGLHQAIEAKEGVNIQQESRTLATISIQNYFRMYEKLSGMTGTAVTESEEFKKIYDTSVYAIPTNLPIARDDKADVVYKTTAAKYTAIVKKVAEVNETGRPILIGTRSIEHNQIIADLLKRKKIPHKVLNAKNHEEEAFIIADAGKKGAITVATNIAGRGVDIVLGGAKPELKDYRKKTQTKTKKKVETYGLQLPPAINPANYKLKQYKQALDNWQDQHDEIIELGGLFILGTERHESRRIDNQLRGRSGRQGDPGTSQFFVSLDDEIMRIFGGEQIAKVMDFLNIEEDQPIEHNMVSKSIESAQVKVEGFFFDQRKRLVDFDDVMNTQRDIIYKRRRSLLELTAEDTDDTLKEEILHYTHNEIESILHSIDEDDEKYYQLVVNEFCKMIPFDQQSQDKLAADIAQQSSDEAVTAYLLDVAQKIYATKETTFGEEQMASLERIVTLSTVDEKWMDHLDAVESLRQGIWLRGDKQTVLAEYKKEAFTLFEQLVTTIESTIAHRIYRVEFARPQPTDLAKNAVAQHERAELPTTNEPAQPQKPTSTNAGVSDLAQALKTAKAGPQQNPGTAKVKIGRNDPCPCGSGKKYKKCGLINAPSHKG